MKVDCPSVIYDQRKLPVCMKNEDAPGECRPAGFCVYLCDDWWDGWLIVTDEKEKEAPRH